jgi:mannosyltransferase OCH1-like enzyme
MFSPTRTWNGWHKFLLFAVIALLLVAHLSRTTTSLRQWPSHASKLERARYLSPHDLMSRPFAGVQTEIPKIFHQSWSSNELPAKFERWSETCRVAHPDWEWVLWTDDDNLELLERFMPAMLPTYHKLAGPIFRADIVRNAYMFLFGGRVSSYLQALPSTDYN